MAKPDSSKGTGLEIYFRLLTYVKPFWFAFSIGIVGLVLYAATQTVFAALFEYLVDSINSEDSSAYIYGPLALVGIAIVRGVGGFTGNYLVAYVARNVVHCLRLAMFDRLLILPMNYYHDHSTGHILSKLTFNVEQVTSAATDSLKVAIREGATVIGLVGYLLYLNWKLTLVFAGITPLIALVVWFASKRFRRLGHRIQDSMGEVTHISSEAIQGFQVVRVFGGVNEERKRFFAASKKNLQQSLKMAVTEALSTPVVMMLVTTAMALLVFLALHPVINSGMTPGQFVAFIIAAGLVAKPLRALTEVNSKIQKGIAASESIFELLDTEGERDSGDLSLACAQGRLNINRLNFSYDGEKPALIDIDLEVQSGKTVALVGKSGSGKSTLVSLLPRFYDVTSGQIELDGISIEKYKLDDLRKQIALVSQNVVLFAGTIRENIAYGSMRDATDEQIQAAASAAHLMEFVERLPEGLDTLVGEKGVKLSGGQRQRIAIARAILKNAPVLILDEATSALDTESERHIQAALENVMHGRTTIVIAHRLSTIENADEIVVMEQGEIVERGTHQELLKLEGAYAGLHKLQFSDVRTDNTVTPEQGSK